MAQENKNTPLFQEEKKRGAILLVDRSGSTGSNAKVDVFKTIFDRMAEICCGLGHQDYRVVFWNSPNYNDGRFIRGQMAIPFVVRSDALHTAFATAATAVGGGTCPSLGFQAIKPEWLVGDPMVYFVTDGQIGCSEMNDATNRQRLAEEIRKLPCQLTIVAVEAVVRDFNKVEQVDNAAGGDIYRIIREERLTGKVNKFISYGPNGSFTQINKVRAPAGFAPYGDKYFSVLRVPEFMQFIHQELTGDADEAKQLAIAQKLSTTLEVLTRDRPARISDDIIRTFARMFTIDQDMVHYIMTGAIAQERGGQAQVFANYRSQLKNLFAQADGLLKQDVCAALGMNGDFITPIVENRLLSGSYRLIDKTVTIHGSVFPRGGFTPSLPVFPLLNNASKLSDMQDQCLRQWIRAVYAALYRVHPTADEIIYLLLGDMLRVCSSTHTSARIKVGYRQLARCILRKKRLNSMQTEMDLLMAGELPIPNSGKFEDFETYMRNVGVKLNLAGEPMKLWYDICLALDPMLAVRQRVHCEAYITPTDTSDTKEDMVPEGASLDYDCIVTLDDLSLIGGYRFKPHAGVAGNCSPVYLVSREGKQQMLNGNVCACPVCYKELVDDDFIWVGPKVAFDLPASYAVVAPRFAEAAPVAAGGNPRNFQPRNEPRNAPRANQNAKQTNPKKFGGIRNANGQTGTLVIMKGVVGSGKSHASAIIKATVEARGGTCFVEGTDQYCKTGMNSQNAIVQVNRQLLKVQEEKNDDLVVIIDTCGERGNRGNPVVFDVDFTGWKYVEVFPNLDRNNMSGYFAWSLRNVLRRGAVNADTDYYLSPTGAGVAVCIDVHKKKAKALFNQREFQAWQFAGASLANLDGLANAYAAGLKPFEMPVDI